MVMPRKYGSILVCLDGSICPIFFRRVSSRNLSCAGWCHPLSPKRDQGDPQSFRLRSEDKEVGAGGGNFDAPRPVTSTVRLEKLEL